MLRCLILAFTGDQTASVLDEPEEVIEHSAAVTAMQALDQMGPGLQSALLPTTVYQVVTGSGF